MDKNINFKNEILDHISSSSEAHFAFLKYQQRDEDEMSINQRRTLAECLLNKSKTMFLDRFGFFLKADHLKYFDELELDDKDKENLIKRK